MPQDEASLLNQLADEFDASWQSDEPPSIEAFLSRCPEEFRADLFRDLLGIDLDRRQERGESPDPCNYFSRHPEYSDTIAEYFSDGEEFATTVVAGDTDPRGQATDREGFVQDFGDYHLLGEIARGGMGVVYKARQINADRIVALKMVLSGQLAGEEDVLRFQSEARAAARLDHPNLVPIFDVGEHDGHHFFSMALVEGKSLADHITARRFSPREAAALLKQVCDGVAFAHQRGIVHRDLKPANILIDRNGQPKVTDFGLAKNNTDDNGLTLSGQVLGTPGFMPPEQARGEIDRVGPSADVYALGATLFNMLTSQPPFRSPNVMVTLQQVLEKEPTPPQKLNSQVDDDLNAICLKCMEKEPGRRYPSVAHLAEELDRYLRGVPILARPIGRMERGWRWCRRNPVIAGLGSLLALSLIAGICLSTAFAIEAQDRAREAQSNLVEAENQRNAALEAQGVAETAQEKAKSEEKRADEQAELALMEAGNALVAKQQAIQEKEVAQRQYEAARRALYEADLAIAELYREKNNVGTTRERLSQSPVDLRDWRWHRLKTLSDGSARRVALSLVPIPKGGHPEIARAMAVTSDGRQVAIGTYRTIQLRWASNGKLIRKWNTNNPGTLSFSPDNKRLVSSEHPPGIRVWDVATGTLVRARQVGRNLTRSGKFLPDGKTIVYIETGNNKITVWEYEKDEVVQTSNYGPTPLQAVVSPDGEHLAVYRTNAVAILNLQTGERVSTLQGLRRTPTAITFDPTGKKLATGGADHHIRIWEAATGQLIQTIFGHGGPVGAVAFSPDGRILASGSDDTTVRLWDHEDGVELALFRGAAAGIRRVAFAANGKTLLSLSTRELHIWNAGFDECVQQKGFGRPIESIRFLPDGVHTIISSHYQHYWNAVSGVSHGFKGPDGRVVAINPAGTRVALSGGANARGHRNEVRKLPPIGPVVSRLQLGKPFNEIPVRKAFIDDKHLATFDARGVIKIWDTDSGEARKEFRPGGTAVLAASRRECVVLTQDATEIWSLWDGEKQKSLPIAVPTGTAYRYSQDGRWLAAGYADGHIRVYSLENPGEEPVFLFGHDSTVTALDLTPDNGVLVSSSRDRTVRVWDMVQRSEHTVLRGHRAAIFAVEFSPQGQIIASGDESGVVKTWLNPVWIRNTNSTLRTDGQGLQVIADRKDPRFILTLPASTSGKLQFVVHMKSDRKQFAQLFFRDADDPKLNRVNANTHSENVWKTLDFDFETNDSLTQIRFDPISTAGNATIAWMELRKRDSDEPIVRRWSFAAPVTGVTELPRGVR